LKIYIISPLAKDQLKARAAFHFQAVKAKGRERVSPIYARLAKLKETRARGETLILKSRHGS
jgi:hypothetical protein